MMDEEYEAFARYDRHKSLGNYPLPMVRLACSKCERRGQYQTAKLIERFGPELMMCSLAFHLFECAKRKNYSDYCGFYFPEALAMHHAVNGPLTR
jgi:hypothetical protein